MSCVSVLPALNLNRALTSKHYDLKPQKWPFWWHMDYASMFIFCHQPQVCRGRGNVSTSGNAVMSADIYHSIGHDSQDISQSAAALNGLGATQHDKDLWGTPCTHSRPCTHGWPPALSEHMGWAIQLLEMRGPCHVAPFLPGPSAQRDRSTD